MPKPQRVSTPYENLTDAALVALADTFCARLSYYYAGYDYPESARQEDEARRKLEGEFRPVATELRERGLKPSDPGLMSGYGWWTG